THRIPRLRTYTLGQSRDWRRVQCVPTAHDCRPLVRAGAAQAAWVAVPAGNYPGATKYGYPFGHTRSGDRRHLIGVSEGPTLCEPEYLHTAKGPDALSELSILRIRLGDGHRLERLRGMQRLHHRVPGRKQYPGCRQSGGQSWAAHALASGGHVLPRRPRQSEGLLSAGTLHALRERALRIRLPGGSNRAQQRRPERHGLQPLCGDPLLLEQLSLQSPALQLLLIPGLEHSPVEDDAQSCCDGTQSGRDGEMYV